MSLNKDNFKSLDDLIEYVEDYKCVPIITKIDDIYCKGIHNVEKILSLIEYGELDLTKEYLIDLEHFDYNPYDSDCISLNENETFDLLINEINIMEKQTVITM